MTDQPDEPLESNVPARRRTGLATMIMLGGLGGILAVGLLLYVHARSGINDVPLSASAHGVTAVAAVARPFQPSRRYVGTVEPWVQSRIGPQMVSAYVDTVLVRPGAIVKRGEVIATLDCRNASALNRAIAAQARALDAQRAAAAGEASRTASLLDGKFVSQNEVDVKNAEAASKNAQLAGLQAQALDASLHVDDCVLRAPFDGEIAERTIDPGAFVRPGSAIATIVDRHIARITADVPEDDFGAVPPGAPVRIHLLATGRDLTAVVSRRAPAADPMTRTAHIEIDVLDAGREVPVWTTASLSLDVGQPVPATAIPLAGASVHGGKATLFVTTGTTAHQTLAKVIGERDGVLYIDPATVAAGTPLVTEGRTVLTDGDIVTVAIEAWQP